MAESPPLYFSTANLPLSRPSALATHSLLGPLVLQLLIPPVHQPIRLDCLHLHLIFLDLPASSPRPWFQCLLLIAATLTPCAEAFFQWKKGGKKDVASPNSDHLFLLENCNINTSFYSFCVTEKK
jgi:hypothetical protein